MTPVTALGIGVGVGVGVGAGAAGLVSVDAADGATLASGADVAASGWTPFRRTYFRFGFGSAAAPSAPFFLLRDFWASSSGLLGTLTLGTLTLASLGGLGGLGTLT